MSRRENLIVGLDIGTTKICTVVGEVLDDGAVNVIGVGTNPSRGLRKGVVINIDGTVDSIKKAVEEAELMGGCDISSVYGGIAGGHIKGFNSHGIIAVKDREIKDNDVRRVIDAARAVAIPMDREVIHILPSEFVVDEQEGIKDPLGMKGVRLEVNCHIVTGAAASAANIVKCANQSGLNVHDIVLEPLASAEAVLSQDEKDLGVALIDIGGGTSDLVVFHEGTVKHSAVLALGGNHITNDIALGLRTPASPSAENLKRRYGCAQASMVDPEEEIEVPSVGGRPPRMIKRQILCEIIEQRVEEILQLVQREVAKSGYDDVIASGVVLTGGTALMKGIAELAETVFGFSTRVGIPAGIGGLSDMVASPMFATGVGLVLYGSQYQDATRFKIRDNRTFENVLERMKGWLREFF